MKKAFNILIALLLVLGISMQPRANVQMVKAADNCNKTNLYSPRLKVLEITDPSGTKLTWESSKYEVTQMTMKKFVASREELDGKYDLIAISKGSYSTYGVQGKDHNTTLVMNDITNLKANEIITQFIDKGQPVILEKNSMLNGRKGKLQENFSKYSQTNNNVIVYDSKKSYWKSNLESELSDFFNSCDYKERPRFNLTNKPSNDPNMKYKPEDKLGFDISIQKPNDVKSRSLKAYLYIDADFNDRFAANEIVAEQVVENQNQKLTFQLPNGYSGIRNWKLEVVDMGSNLKDYDTGTIYFMGQEVKVNVLQVLQSSDNSSSLQKETNMKQTYLKKSGEYDINIDVTTMDDFNKNTHQQINGKYDMVIFGFADTYNNASISNSAVESVKKFIDTKQSIMFTHDTIFQSGNNWVKYFMDDTGQKSPQTDLGLGAPNKSKTTKKVNDGLITTYPNSLGDSIEVALTHNQYYTLDLEDENVIPWYNMVSDNNRDRNDSLRDVDDSWNHYYTYSKGNITYSGTGHTNTRFPDPEQRLFVNTMYRAFIGSNHAPIITVNTPMEKDYIPTYQNIELSYKLQDYDLLDKKLNTTVYLNDQKVFEQKGVANGSTIVQSIPHGKTNTEDVTLKIVAEDERGAKSEKILKLKIVKVDAGLKVTRSMSTNDIVPINKQIDIAYNVEPFLLTEAANKIKPDVKEFSLKDVVFKENFPAYLDVQTPNGFERTGSLENGYTITKKYDSITFKRNQNGEFIAPAKFNFTIAVTPKKKNNYVLAASAFTYKNMDNENKTDSFNPLTIRADIILDRLELEDAIINKGMSENFMTKLKVFPEELKKEDLSITWSESSNGSILSVDPKTGVVTAINKGEANVTATVTDAFGNTKTVTCKVTVRTPIKSIILKDITVKVGEDKELDLMVDPDEAKSSVSITIENKDLASMNGFMVKGLKPGDTKITATGLDKDGKIITATAILTVEKIKVTDISVSPSFVKIDKNETYDKFVVTINPDNATDKTLQWKSLNPAIVEVVADGRIKGISTGETEIEISSPDGPKAYVKVKVGSPLTGIGSSDFTIEKGDFSKNMSSYYWKVPADATNVSPKLPVYTSSNSNLLEIDSNGKIIPKRTGTVTVTVELEDEKGNVFTTSMTVTIVEPGEANSSTSKW